MIRSGSPEPLKLATRRHVTQSLPVEEPQIMRVTHSFSQVHGVAAKPDRRTRASPEHGSDQQVKSDRPDAKTVVPTTDSEQELPPAHTRAIQRQRTRLAPGRVSWHGSVGGSALHTVCRTHRTLIYRQWSSCVGQVHEVGRSCSAALAAQRRRCSATCTQEPIGRAVSRASHGSEPRCRWLSLQSRR